MVKALIKKQTNTTKTAGSTWSAPIYVYWFIILFFIAATFYILGRSHGITHNSATLNEEILMQANDYYNAGKTKLESGDIEGAVADLTAVIDSGAVSGTAYLARGEAYMLSGDYKKAMSDFESAIKHDTTNALGFYDKALLEMRLEDYDAAMVDINNALVVAASNSNSNVSLRDLYAKRGKLNLWLKNWDGAIADYTNSLARPEGTVSPDVYAERAEAYTAKGEYANAINDYASAMQVVKEQLGAITDVDAGEKLSRDVMLYTEKSAALFLKLDNKDSALTNLQAALQIATALNDTESIEHLNKLISDLQESINTGTTAPNTEVKSEPVPDSTKSVQPETNPVVNDTNVTDSIIAPENNPEPVAESVPTVQPEPTGEINADVVTPAEQNNVSEQAA